MLDDNIDHLEPSKKSFVRGLQLFELGRFKEALKAFHHFLRHNPEDPIGYENIGLCYYNLDKTDEAIVFAKKALSLSPQSGRAEFVIGGSYFKKGQLERAEKHLRNAIKYEPEEALYHTALGGLFLGNMDYDGAIQHLDHALSLNPLEPMALNFRAQAALQKNEPAEAWNLIQQVLKEDPENAYHHAIAGRIKGNYRTESEVDYHFGESIRLDPEDESFKKEYLSSLFESHFFFGKIYPHNFPYFRNAMMLSFIYCLGVGFVNCIVIIRYLPELAAPIRISSLLILPAFSVYAAIPQLFHWIEGGKKWGWRGMNFRWTEALGFIDFQLALWLLLIVVWTNREGLSGGAAAFCFFLCILITISDKGEKEWLKKFLKVVIVLLHLEGIVILVLLWNGINLSKPIISYSLILIFIPLIIEHFFLKKQE